MSPTFPVLESCQPSSFHEGHKYGTPLTSITPRHEEPRTVRCSPARGAMAGILLGAGFWAAILVVVFKH